MDEVTFGDGKKERKENRKNEEESATRTIQAYDMYRLKMDLLPNEMGSGWGKEEEEEKRVEEGFHQDVGREREREKKGEWQDAIWIKWDEMASFHNIIIIIMIQRRKSSGVDLVLHQE